MRIRMITEESTVYSAIQDFVLELDDHNIMEPVELGPCKSRDRGWILRVVREELATYGLDGSWDVEFRRPRMVHLVFLVPRPVWTAVVQYPDRTRSVFQVRAENVYSALLAAETLGYEYSEHFRRLRVFPVRYNK